MWQYINSTFGWVARWARGEHEARITLVSAESCTREKTYVGKGLQHFRVQVLKIKLETLSTESEMDDRREERKCLL